MKTRFLILCTIILAATTLSDQNSGAISSFVTDTVFRNAGISIAVRDVNSGELLEAYNENMALTSASVMKLVTTGVALEILGPGMVFTTRIASAGEIKNGTLEGFLIIQGGGDPALGSEYFTEHYGDFISEWVNSVKEAGIGQIDGRIIADASVFSYRPAAPGWNWSDIGNYYGAGVHGISAFDNLYRVYLRSGMEGSSPEILGVDPEIPGLQIESRLRAEGKRDRGYVYLPPYGKEARIEGTIPANRDTFALKASIPDPPLLLATMLQNRIIDSGIALTGQPGTHREFPGYMTDELLSKLVYIATLTSPPLGEIIKITNIESVNLFAESMLWILDYQVNRHLMADPEGGLKIVADFLESKGISSSGLYMTDGSGLSRSNALSSSFITDYLVYMGRNASYSKLFRSSLAVPGAGTFEPYFLTPELKNNMAGKSGTVARVRNYAGYLRTKSGRELAFGILTNNFDCTSHQVSKRVETLLQSVYENY